MIRLTSFLPVVCAAAVACSSPSSKGETDVGSTPVAMAQAPQKGETAPATDNVSPEVEARDVTPASPAPAEPETKPAPPAVEAPPLQSPPADAVMGKVSLRGVEKARWWKFGDHHFRLWGTQFTGSQPKGVSVSSDGSMVFVTNTGFHNHTNVTRFDPVDLSRVVEASFKGNAIESLVSPDDKYLWVSNFYHKEVLELHTDTLKVNRRFKVENVPKHFALHPDGTTLWISNWSKGTTSIVDLATGKAVQSIEVGKQPRGTVILNSGAKAYVTNFGGKSVSVIDTDKREVIKTIKAGCRAPRHADVTDDDRVLVSCYGGREVLVIDSNTDEIVKRLEVGNGPKTIAISRDQRYAYTADYRGATMSFIDLQTWETLVVPLPTFKTSGLFVQSDDRRIYLTGWTARNLMVIERLMPGDVPVKKHGPMKAGKVCRQTPKSDCYKYP